MIRVFKETNKKLDEFTIENKDFLVLHDPNLMPKGSWIHVSDPDEKILSEISKLTSIPLDFLMSSLDEEESARIDKDDDASLIVLDTPFLIDEEKKLYTTAPFIISYNQSYYAHSTVTANPQPVPMVKTIYRPWSMHGQNHHAPEQNSVPSVSFAASDAVSRPPG